MPPVRRRSTLRTTLRKVPEPPKDLALVVSWLQGTTNPVAELPEPGTGTARCRALLDRISRWQEAAWAAANTVNRKRAVPNNLMQYAVDTGALTDNPLKSVKSARPRTLRTVNPRTVVKRRPGPAAAGSRTAARHTRRANGCLLRLPVQGQFRPWTLRPSSCALYI